MDDPNAKAVAELKIATAATALGLPVLRPMSERGRYDLAFDIGDRLLRDQCKGASVRGDVAIVRPQSSYLLGTGAVTSVYRADEVDAIAVYCSQSTGATCCQSSWHRGCGRSIFGSDRRGTASVRRYTGRPTTSFLGL